MKIETSQYFVLVHEALQFWCIPLETVRVDGKLRGSKGYDFSFFWGLSRVSLCPPEVSVK